MRLPVAGDIPSHSTPSLYLLFAQSARYISENFSYYYTSHRPNPPTAPARTPISLCTPRFQLPALEAIAVGEAVEPPASVPVADVTLAGGMTFEATAVVLGWTVVYSVKVTAEFAVLEVVGV